MCRSGLISRGRDRFLDGPEAIFFLELGFVLLVIASEISGVVIHNLGGFVHRHGPGAFELVGGAFFVEFRDKVGDFLFGIAVVRILDEVIKAIDDGTIDVVGHIRGEVIRITHGEGWGFTAGDLLLDRIA